MNVKITANTDAYLEGMRKADTALKRERRRETAWQWAGIIFAGLLIAWVFVSAIIMIVEPAR